METTTALLSVRKLLAFACLQLSLVLVGVGLITFEVGHEAGGVLLYAGLTCLVVSAVWLFRTATTPNPAAFDETSNEAADDGENTGAGAAGEESAAGVESD